jgi:hypothetical protein
VFPSIPYNHGSSPSGVPSTKCSRAHADALRCGEVPNSTVALSLAPSLSPPLSLFSLSLSLTLTLFHPPVWCLCCSESYHLYLTTLLHNSTTQLFHVPGCSESPFIPCLPCTSFRFRVPVSISVCQFPFPCTSFRFRVFCREYPHG